MSLRRAALLALSIGGLVPVSYTHLDVYKRQVFVGSLLSDEDWIRVLAQAKQEHAQGEAWIVQAFVPQRPIWTPFGPRLLTLGAYVLNGRFCGYFARLTPDSHASHNALCLPVFVRSEPEKEP